MTIMPPGQFVPENALIGDGYTIGISIFVTAEGKLGLFENGLRQNVLFLHALFQASPRCKRVFLLNHGDGEPVDPMGEAGIPPESIVRTHTVLDELDYVISIGGALDRETVAALKQRHIPVIGYKCGNGGVIAMEAMCADPPRPDAERYFDKDYFDLIWMTPQHIHTYKGWCETVYRAPVVEVGQVWSPWFVERRPEGVLSRYGYRPGNRPWRVGVLDPNITVMKTSHMPMLVCEAAWRARPDSFASFRITNADRYADNAGFMGFFHSLGAAQAGRMVADARYVGIDFIADHCDAVVTHHWENGLNYLYYEVLHGGYPLIHNSGFLRDYGYYYPDFQAIRGGQALLEAVANHDENLEAYRVQCARLIESVSPVSDENIMRHEQLLAMARAHVG
ncbi:MAG: DUF2827 family protein [Sphingomonadaceae bacterium]